MFFKFTTDHLVKLPYTEMQLSKNNVTNAFSDDKRWQVTLIENCIRRFIDSIMYIWK